MYFIISYLPSFCFGLSSYHLIEPPLKFVLGCNMVLFPTLTIPFFSFNCKFYCLFLHPAHLHMIRFDCRYPLPFSSRVGTCNAGIIALWLWGIAPPPPVICYLILNTVNVETFSNGFKSSPKISLNFSLSSVVLLCGL